MFGGGKHEYSRLEHEDNDIGMRSELDGSGLRRRRMNMQNGFRAVINIKTLTTILFAILLASGSFFAGKHAARRTSLDPLHLNGYSTIFRYNRTFGEDSSSTATAWASLFPKHGGFFKHPVLAEQRSAFSVFHQLHCLNGIREGYWSLYQAMHDGVVIDDDSMPMMGSPPHLRHCVDLIRQALICQPDLTREVKDEEAGGVKGFGTRHICKDWQGLMSWVEQWEEYEPESATIDEVQNRNKSMSHGSHHSGGNQI